MPQKRILISRPDRLGDVVLSTPLPREIKKQFSDAFVAVLLRPYAKDVYLNNPFVDEIIIYDPESSDSNFLSKVMEIRKYNFTDALMLLPTEKVNWLLFFAGIKNRIGVGHKFYQFLTNTKSVYRNKYIPLRNEADYCMDLARKIGVVTNNIDSEIYLNEDEKIKVEEIRNKFVKPGEIFVNIHTTSGNSAPNWKPETYKRLIEELQKIPRIKVAITDLNPPEILDNLEDVIYPHKNLSMRESILNFAASNLLISASTGPMHVCGALKVKTLSIFCPLTACSPKLWGTSGNDAEFVLPEKNYCSVKCPGDPKKCSFENSEKVNPEFVAEKVKEIFKL